MIAPRSDCRTVFILAQNIPEITNLKPNSNVQIAIYTAIAVQITCLNLPYIFRNLDLLSESKKKTTGPGQSVYDYQAYFAQPDIARLSRFTVHKSLSLKVTI